MRARMVSGGARVPAGIYGCTLWHVQPAGHLWQLRRDSRRGEGVWTTNACPRRWLAREITFTTKSATMRKLTISVTTISIKFCIAQ